MGRDVSTKIIIFSAADGRVRLTTKSGVTFDARLLRWEHKPKHVAVIEPIGCAVRFGEFVPEVLRVAMAQIVDAGRVEGPRPRRTSRSYARRSSGRSSWGRRRRRRR
ncbi:hypothetical protein OV079_22865 [Nannocystis pusilla]|uniref:Uncharacterized protein n=1 Tax=Nannocystis pusilla TaxID=889268 RepID=A0A9X3EYK5_9BACT|nr:hypothetical protein [Nannocystis pusilla]MCY1008346.1 hypothetical protein [Nannocystis pusilla]